MDPWRSVLLLRLRDQNEKVSAERRKILELVRGKSKMDPCGRCKLRCYEGDLLALPCTHRQCFDCVEDQLERQRGYLEREYPHLVQSYPFLSNVVVCSSCHRPWFVNHETVFRSGFAQKDAKGVQGRVVFVVAKDQDLSDNAYVWEYYENQRREFLKFCNESLWFFERKPQSTKEGGRFDVAQVNALSDSKLLKKAFPDLTDGAGYQYLWLEGWTCDATCGDPQGWQYAFNWPSNDSSWVNGPSGTTFVRRRRMLRVCVRLKKRSDDLPNRESE